MIHLTQTQVASCESSQRATSGNVPPAVEFGWRPFMVRRLPRSPSWRSCVHRSREREAQLPHPLQPRTRRKRLSASRGPAAIQRRVIPPPFQRLTLRLIARTAPSRFYGTSFLARVRSRAGEIGSSPSSESGSGRCRAQAAGEPLTKEGGLGARGSPQAPTRPAAAQGGRKPSTD